MIIIAAILKTIIAMIVFATYAGLLVIYSEFIKSDIYKNYMNLPWWSPFGSLRKLFITVTILFTVYNLLAFIDLI